MVKGINPIIISEQIWKTSGQSKQNHSHTYHDAHTQSKHHTEKQLASPRPPSPNPYTHTHTPHRKPHRTACAHTHTQKHTGQLFLTSMTPWWMEVYCFFLSITKVMTITVAMTTPPTIRPMMAPLLETLLEPTSSAKKTCGKVRGQAAVSRKTGGNVNFRVLRSSSNNPPLYHNV